MQIDMDILARYILDLRKTCEQFNLDLKGLVFAPRDKYSIKGAMDIKNNLLQYNPTTREYKIVGIQVYYENELG